MSNPTKPMLRKAKAKCEEVDMVNQPCAEAEVVYAEFLALREAATKLATQYDAVAYRVEQVEIARGIQRHSRSSTTMRNIAQKLRMLTNSDLRASLGLPPMMTLADVVKQWLKLTSVSKPIELRSIENLEAQVIVDGVVVGVMQSEDRIRIDAMRHYWNLSMRDLNDALPPEATDKTLLSWREDIFTNAGNIRAVVDSHPEGMCFSILIPPSKNRVSSLPMLFGYSGVTRKGTVDNALGRGVPLAYVARSEIDELLSMGYTTPVESDDDDPDIEIYDLAKPEA